MTPLTTQSHAFTNIDPTESEPETLPLIWIPAENLSSGRPVRDARLKLLRTSQDGVLLSFFAGVRENGSQIEVAARMNR